MKNMLFSATAMVAGIALVASDASARTPEAPAVAISWSGSNFTATGSVGAAHNSASTLEEIGCEIRAYGDPQAIPPNDEYNGTCKAVKSDGTTASCLVSGPTQDSFRLARAIGAINGSSFIDFRGSNGGLCTEITVDNNAKYVAKKSGLKAGDAGSPVVITDGNAVGSLGSARTSGDTKQYIGCNVVTNTLDGDPRTGFCEAQDAAGNYAYCTTTRSNVIDVMSMIKSDSYVEFAGGGECGGRFQVINSSKYRPSH